MTDPTPARRENAAALAADSLDAAELARDELEGYRRQVQTLEAKVRELAAERDLWIERAYELRARESQRETA